MATRREFMAVSAGVALLGSGLSEAQETASGSALVTGKLMPMKDEELMGFLSRDQLSPYHVAHYGGAFKSLQKIEQELGGQTGRRRTRTTRRSASSSASRSMR